MAKKQTTAKPFTFADECLRIGAISCAFYAKSHGKSDAECEEIVKRIINYVKYEINNPNHHE